MQWHSNCPLYAGAVVAKGKGLELAPLWRAFLATRDKMDQLPSAREHGVLDGSEKA